MTWLSAHYEWVVTAVLMPIVLLVLKRWADSAKKPTGAAPAQQPALSVESSPMSNSLIVFGSANTVNIGQPAEALPQVEPVRPKLSIEIAQVCFCAGEDFVGQNLSDFRVDRYIFVHVWMVNTESVTTSLKQLSLRYSNAGETVPAVSVSDFSKWFQRINSEEPGRGFETRLVQTEHRTLTPFPLEPLQQGIPLKGWVCFKASGVMGRADDEAGSIELCVVDSFGKEHRVKSPAPFACKGTMVDNLDVWRRLTP